MSIKKPLKLKSFKKIKTFYKEFPSIQNEAAAKTKENTFSVLPLKRASIKALKYEEINSPYAPFD